MTVRNWWRKLFSQPSPKSRRRGSHAHGLAWAWENDMATQSRGHGTRRFLPRVEQLEDRTLFATDVTITAAAGVTNGTFVGGVFTPNAGAANATIGAPDIQGALNAGTSVTINTASTGTNVGSINEDAGATISKTAGGNATLTFNASAVLSISQAITSTSGQLSVVGNSVSSTRVAAAISANGGSISFTSSASIAEVGAGSLSTTGLLTTNSAGGTTLNGPNAVGSFNATNTIVGAISLTNSAATLTVTGIAGAFGTATVTTTAAGGVINVGDAGNTLAGITAPLTLAGATTVNLNDQGNATAAQAYTLTSTTFQRAGGGLITYGTPTNLNVNIGSGGDTVNVVSTIAGTTAIIDGGAGADTFNVGNAGTLDNILGSAILRGNAGSPDVVNLNDQADAGPNTYTLSNNTFTRTGAAAVSFVTVEEVNLNASLVGDTINVTSSFATVTTTVNAGAGDDIFNVGIIGSLGSLLGPVFLNGDANSDTLNVDDTNDAGPNAYTLTTTTLDRSGAGLITYGTMENLVLNASVGSDTINVQSTLAATPVTLNGGTGDDTFNVGNASNSLDNIQGAVTINGDGQTATDTVNINDQGDPDANGYTITITTVVRTGAAQITYGTVETLVVNAGLSDDTLAVQSTLATTPLTVNGGAGDDTFNVGDGAGGMGNILGTVILNGNAHVTRDQVNFNDQATPSAPTYTLTNNTLTRTSAAAVSFVNVEQVSLNATFGPNTINVTSSFATVTTVVNAGNLGDTINVGNAGSLDLLLGPVFLNGNVITDTLNINDQNDAGPNTYTLTGTTVARGGAGLITYGMMENLVLNASMGADTITIQSAPAATATVNGGGGSDTLVGPDLTNSWNITASNAGNITGVLSSFIGIANLTGGTGADTFNFSDTFGVTGAIDGGAGADTLNYAAYTTAVVVNLGSNAPGLTSSLDAEQEVPPTTSPATGTATLTYNNVTNTFDISGTIDNFDPTTVTGFHIHRAPVGINGPIIVDLGGLTRTPAGTGFTFSGTGLALPATDEAAFLGGITYINIHNATFPGGATRGQIFPAGAYVNAPGRATGTNGISNIENVTGGIGADSVVGNASANTLSGGPGNDTLLGDRGNDTVAGDADNDIMVWSNGDGTDIMDGGTGTDLVQVNGAVGAGDTFVVGPGAGGRVAFQRTNLGPFALDIGTVETLTVNGIGGDDTLTVNDLTGVTDLTLLNFNGFAGNNTLLGPNAATTWNITRANRGNFTNAAVTANFVTTQNLTGGTNSDSFVFTDGVGVSGVIDGGTGTDTLNYSAYTTAVSVNLGSNAPGLVSSLDAQQEVPPTTSIATGTVNLTYNNVAHTFDISGTINDFDPTTVTGFHIHRAPFGVNGPIIVNLGGLPRTPSGTGFTFSGTGLALPVTDEAAFLGGLTYVNIHNATFPGGAIRGQVFATTAFVAATATATGTGGIANIENATGGTGNDSLFGSNSANSLAGGAGNDTVVGSRGNDVMAGDADNDIMVWNNGDGTDIMDGGTGTDRVQVNGAIPAGDVFVVSPGPGGRVDFDRTNLVPFSLDIGTVETLTVNGIDGDDSFTVNDMTGVTDLTAINFNGLAGNNTLRGPNAATTWNLTGANRGNFTNAAVAVNYATTQNLTGGTNNDSVIFAAAATLSGTLNGGTAGSDSLDNSAIAGAVNALNGNGTNHGFMGTATGLGGIFDNIDALNPAASAFVVNGTGGNDTLFLINNGGAVQYTLNGAAPVNVPAGIPQFIFNGNGGSDAFTINFSGGVFPFAITDNSAGATNAVLSVIGDGATTTAVYLPDATTPGNGTITINGTQVITFIGLTPVDMSGMATATISFPNANDIVDIANGFAFTNPFPPALIISGTSGGVAFETVAAFNNINLVIDTGPPASPAGNDTITITSGNNAHGNTNVSINTGATGTDSLTINGPITVAGTLSLVVNGPITEAAGGAVGANLLTTSSVGGTSLNNAGNVIPTFNAANNTSGDISLLNGFGNTMSIAGINQSGGGNVTVNAFFGITTTAAISTTADGNITLATTAGAVTIDGAVAAGGAGDVTLLAMGGMVDVNINANVSSTTGDITATAARAVFIGAGSVTTAGNVTLTGQTSIVSQVGAGIISANLLTTSSVGGTNLGGATVAAFNATNTVAGGLGFGNTAATLTITGISQSGGGLVDVNNTGGISTTGAITSSAGNINLTATGAVSIMAAITASAGNVNLTTTGAISESGAGAISGALLTTSSGGGTTLNGANTVTTFNAANTTSGDIGLTNTAATLTITGISQSGGGNVAVTNTGAISVTGSIAAGAGNITLSSTATIAETGAGAISGALLTTNSVGGTTLNGANAVTGFNATNTTSSDIGLTNTAATLTITGISQSGGGNVAVTNSGSITISGAITAVTANVNLTATGSISETGAGAISCALLTTNSATGTTLDGANTVATFSASNSTSGNVSLTNTAAPLTITGVTQVAGGNVTINNTGGVTTTGIVDGDVTINATNTINLGADVVAPGGTITLNTTAGGATQNAGSLLGVNLVLLGNGNFALNGPGNANNVGTLAGAILGSLTYRNVAALTIGTVGAAAGITTGNAGTNGGNVTINSDVSITVNSPISTAAGTGGTLTIGSGVTINAAITVGAGNVTLNGGAGSPDLVVCAPITSASTITLTALRDVIICGAVTTTTAGANIVVTADTDNNGVGGVWIQNKSAAEMGRLNSAGTITVTGSALFATMPAPAPTGDTVAIDTIADAVRAAGNITLQASAVAPATARMHLNGSVTSTGGGSITITNTGAVIATASFTTAANGNVSVTNNATQSLSAITAGGTGTVTLTANGAASNLFLNGAVSSGTGNITLTAGSNIVANGVTTSSPGNITFSAGAAIGLVSGTVSVTGSGTVTLTAGLDPNQNGLIAEFNGTISAPVLTTSSRNGTLLYAPALNNVNSFVATNVGGGDIHLDNVAAPLALNAINQSGGGDVIIDNTGGINVAAAMFVNNAGNVILNSTAAVNVNASVRSIGGNITLCGTAIALNAPVDAGSGIIRINSGSTVTQNAAGILTSGGLGVIANGAVTLDQPNLVTGTLSMVNTAAGAPIVFVSNAVGAITVGTITAAACYPVTTIGVTSNAGDILIRNGQGDLTLVSPISTGGLVNTVRLFSGGTVTSPTTTGTITAGTLGVIATSDINLTAGGVALAQSNLVGNFSATSTAGAISFNDGNTGVLTIGATVAQGTLFAGTTGVSTAGPSFTLLTAGSLQVVNNLSVPAGNILLIVAPAQSGNVTITGATVTASTTNLFMGAPAQTTDQSLIVNNPAGGLFLPSGTFNFFAQGGGNHFLSLRDGGNAGLNENYVVGLDLTQGTILYSGSFNSVLAFIGINNDILDTVAVNTQTVTGRDGNEIIAVTDSFNFGGVDLLAAKVDGFQTLLLARKTNLVIEAQQIAQPIGDTINLNFSRGSTGLTTVTANGSSAFDTFNLTAVNNPVGSALTAVTVNARESGDTINVTGVNAASAAVTIIAAEGIDTVTIANPTPYASLTANGDTGDDVFNINNTPASGPTTVNGGPGTNLYNVGTGNLDTIAGPLFINGNFVQQNTPRILPCDGSITGTVDVTTAGDTIILRDQDNPAATVYTLTQSANDPASPSLVTRTNTSNPPTPTSGTITYTQIAQLSLFAGTNNDTVNVQPSTTTFYDLNGGGPLVNGRNTLIVNLFNPDGSPITDAFFQPGPTADSGVFTFTQGSHQAICFVRFQILPQTQNFVVSSTLDPNSPSGVDISVRFGQLANQITFTPPPPPTSFFLSPQFAAPNPTPGSIFAPRVATGDVNGDGFNDIILGAAPGPNSLPFVQVVNGRDIVTGVNPPRVLANFLAYEQAFSGGVAVAAGNILNNGRAQIVTAPVSGGGPNAKIFELQADGSIAAVSSFYAFDPNFGGGLTIAVGDVNNDNRDDVIAGAGPGGGPAVNVFSGASFPTQAQLLDSFFAYDAGFSGGVQVAAGDFNGDSFADILTGPGSPSVPNVRIFNGGALSQPNNMLASFFAFPPTQPGLTSSFSPFPTDGVAALGVGGVSFGDINGDGKLDVIVGAPSGDPARVRIFDGNTLSSVVPPAQPPVVIINPSAAPNFSPPPQFIADYFARIILSDPVANLFNAATDPSGAFLAGNDPFHLIGGVLVAGSTLTP